MAGRLQQEALTYRDHSWLSLVSAKHYNID